ncbi:MAG: cytochrome P450 [Pseudomonadota bacterium]
MSWDPLSPDVMKDPANGHQQLLSQCPVHRYEGFDPPFYTLSLYEDVENALRDTETFSSEFGQGPRFTPPIGMLSNPPQHTFYRGLVQQAFTPKMMAGLRPRIEALTNELIDEFIDKGECDLHDEFAFPLPVVIIAEILGVPTSDLPQFKHWSDMQVAMMGAQDPSIYAEEATAFMEYMRNHMLKRRAQIEADEVDGDSNELLTLMAGYKENGEYLPEEHILSVLNQLLVGGNETTTSLITNCIWRLLQRPELWQQLLEAPDLVGAAIEESLRFDAPVLGLYRNTTRDAELHGTTIPKGSKVYLNYSAANHDPAAFPNPEVFDLERPKKRHLAFGLGVHMCLGAPMARLEGEIALRSLLTRIPNLHLVDDGERITPFFLWGRRKLPVQWG